MKKYVSLFLAFLMLIILVGCGADKKADDVSKQTNNDASGKAQKETEGGLDVDLTALSSTMVYSEVYNMMVNPSDYVGKTVKMSGQFAIYQATDGDGQPVPDQLYYACVISDATACCQQGLEFVLTGEHQYPNDYPELGAEISVVGEFRTYMEGDSQYCHLINAELVD